jgi:hypothetical protein
MHAKAVFLPGTKACCLIAEGGGKLHTQQSWNILEWIDVKAAAGTAGEVGWRAAEKLVDSTWIGSLATMLHQSSNPPGDSEPEQL